MKTSFALAIVWLTETELVLQTLLDSGLRSCLTTVSLKSVTEERITLNFESLQFFKIVVSTTSECRRNLEKSTNHVEQLSLVLEYLKNLNFILFL